MCNQKCRVKAHAKLADQIGIVGRVTAQCLQELAGSRAGNRADIFNDFIGCHANAVIRNRDRLFVFVDTDLESKGFAVFH